MRLLSAQVAKTTIGGLLTSNVTEPQRPAKQLTYNICALTVGNHMLYHQDKHQPAQSELALSIWNQTSDVHRGSTLIT